MTTQYKLLASADVEYFNSVLSFHAENGWEPFMFSTSACEYSVLLRKETK